MGDAKQLRRNFLWNTFGQIVYMVCHFLFGILILSLAGAEQSGIFTTVLPILNKSAFAAANITNVPTPILSLLPPAFRADPA